MSDKGDWSGPRAWLPREDFVEHSFYFSINRNAPICFDAPMTRHERLAFNWYRVRAWIARKLLRVVVE